MYLILPVLWKADCSPMEPSSEYLLPDCEGEKAYLAISSRYLGEDLAVKVRFSFLLKLYLKSHGTFRLYLKLSALSLNCPIFAPLLEFLVFFRSTCASHCLFCTSKPLPPFNQIQKHWPTWTSPFILESSPTSIWVACDIHNHGENKRGAYGKYTDIVFCAVWSNQVVWIIVAIYITCECIKVDVDLWCFIYAIYWTCLSCLPSVFGLFIVSWKWYYSRSPLAKIQF